MPEFRTEAQTAAEATTLPLDLDAASPVDPVTAPLTEKPDMDRYDARAVLGRGGMGEVHLCRDRRVGRDVAMKIVGREHGDSASMRRRFEREARVQAQLEHPSVVPVYDLGEMPDGKAYFTMKRVRGVSLDEVLKQLRHGDEAVARSFSRRRLLTAFSNVCLAVAYAHARGVVHRDLKPANVMLGEFGEVNVLDWGIARVAGGGESWSDDAPPGSAVDPSVLPAGITAAGTIMGTPGYMAPEQALGQPVGPTADVYALGTILFEIAALRPLHEGAPLALMVSTLRGVDARPSVRSPGLEVPPEIDAICVRATALDPEQRYPSARALSEAVESFLDGARDLEQRRKLSEQHVEAAALAAQTDPARAMREVNAALALDATHKGAMRALVDLLRAPQTDLPPSAELELEQSRNAERRRANRDIAPVLTGLLAFSPILLWMGVRSALQFAALVIAMAGVAIVDLWAAGREHLSLRLARLGIVGTFVMFVPMSLILGSFVLMPAPVVGVTIVSLMAFGRDGLTRAVCIASGVATILLPPALEFAGVFPPAYSFHNGVLSAVPRMVDFPRTPTLLFLASTSVASVVLAGRLASRKMEALAQAERSLFGHAWRLRQLIPDEAHRAALGANVQPPHS